MLCSLCTRLLRVHVTLLWRVVRQVIFVAFHGLRDILKRCDRERTEMTHEKVRFLAESSDREDGLRAIRRYLLVPTNENHKDVGATTGRIDDTYNG